MPQEDATSNQPEKKGFFKRLFDNYKPKNYIEAALLVGGIIALAAIPGAAIFIPQLIGGYIGYKNAKANPGSSVPIRVFAGAVLGSIAALGFGAAAAIAGVAAVRGAYNIYKEKKVAQFVPPQATEPQKQQGQPKGRLHQRQHSAPFTPTHGVGRNPNLKSNEYTPN